jgi:hypothetical protein
LRSGFEPFLNYFLALFEVNLGPLLWLKRRQKVDLFFERFLLGLRCHFGRLLGCLEALLGRSAFPKYCKKNNKIKRRFSKSFFFTLVTSWAFGSKVGSFW